MTRSFRDRDYLETVDGLFFTVIGSVHPRDRVLAYLKYLQTREDDGAVERSTEGQ